jgi:N-acetylneuraminic acid mutarotase
MALLLMNAQPILSVSAAEFSQLPALPDREGVAGAFAGVAGDELLVAGGANFPGKKPWEGGKKIWHDTVFALARPEGPWKVVGQLPHPLAYGISVSTKAGVICIGGSDAEKHHAEVFLLTLSRDRVEVKNFPSLPVPLANGAGALVGDTIYIFGGSERPGEQSALNRLFAFDLKAAQPEWHELAACPGKARILPVAAALAGAFYVAGGAALEPTNGTVARAYLRDAWRYQPGTGWKRLADLPKPSVGAPTPAPIRGSEFFIIGGDDGSLVGFQPIEKHPGFAKTMLSYNVRTDLWRISGGVPAPRAVLPTAFWQGRWVMPNGEARPGVRSPEVWTFAPSSSP